MVCAGALLGSEVSYGGIEVTVPGGLFGSSRR